METNLTINQLKTEFSVLTPKVKYADELEVRVVFSNESSSVLRIKTLFLDFPIVLLKVRKAEGEDVLLGPPPLPPMDDGVKGREELKPGHSLRYVYHGSEIFSGKELDPGSYEIRFRYDNEYAQGREWKGTIETDWVRFDIEKRED